MKQSILFFLIVTIFTSCTNVYQKKTPTTYKNNEITSLLDSDDLLIDNLSPENKILSVYKDDVQDKCERKYLKLLKYYYDGDLKISRVILDDILENLEYFYDDNKASDSVMINDFINNFDDIAQKQETSIFKIYNILYSLDLDAEQEQQDEPNELKVVKVNRNKTTVKQNNREFLFLEKKVKTILASRKYKKVSNDFIKDVYNSYQNYIDDKINIQEIFIRFSRYKNFLSKIAKKSNLDNLFIYIPGIMTEFYNGRNNGGIWRLPNNRSYRKIRGDIGASTAAIMSIIKKKVGKKRSSISVMSEIVKERNYNFKNNFKKSDVLNSDFADFLALTIILQNPEQSGIGKLTDKGQNGINKYLEAYKSYQKNPKRYITTKKKKKSKKSSSSKKYVRMKYKIRRGDNLQKIAKLYKTTIRNLKRWNPRTTSKKYLPYGVFLAIRGYAFTTYKVRKGDTIGKICRKKRMELSTFLKVNNLKKRTIYSGRRYFVFK